MKLNLAVGVAAIVLMAAPLTACDEPQSGVLPRAPASAIRPPAAGSARPLTPDQLPRAGQPLRFGVAPFIGADSTGSRFKTVTRFLEETLSVPVELVVTSSYEELIERASKDEVDVALMPPLAYVIASGQNARLRLLATATNRCRTHYSSFFLVRRESPLHELDELRGRRVAFVSETSTSGYLLPVDALSRAGLGGGDIIPVWAGSHTEAIAMMGRGDADAAATATGMLEIAFQDSGRSEFLDPTQFRVLHKAGDLPYDALCTSANVSDDAAATILAAFSLLHPANPDATGAVEAYNFTGFVPAEDRDYDGVRRLRRDVRELSDRPSQHADPGP